MSRLATYGLVVLIPLGVSNAAWGQAATTGSVGCATLTQAAANGMNSRVGADDTIKPPTSVTQMTCLGNFFNGVGLNLVTNLLNPGTLLQAVQGQICGLVQQTWSSLLGGAQCGLSISGFNLGFMGGLGGGMSCPKLAFGGGGPPIASVGVGVGVGNGGGALYIPGQGLGPTGYSVPGLSPGSF